MLRAHLSNKNLFFSVQLIKQKKEEREGERLGQGARERLSSSLSGRNAGIYVHNY